MDMNRSLFHSQFSLYIAVRVHISVMFDASHMKWVHFYLFLFAFSQETTANMREPFKRFHLRVNMWNLSCSPIHAYNNHIYSHETLTENDIYAIAAKFCSAKMITKLYACSAYFWLTLQTNKKCHLPNQTNEKKNVMNKKKTKTIAKMIRQANFIHNLSLTHTKTHSHSSTQSEWRLEHFPIIKCSAFFFLSFLVSLVFFCYFVNVK